MHLRKERRTDVRQGDQDDEDNYRQSDQVGNDAVNDIVSENYLQADDHEERRPERNHGVPNLPGNDAEVVQNEQNAGQKKNNAAQPAAATTATVVAAAHAASAANGADGVLLFCAADLFAEDRDMRFGRFIFGILIFHISIFYQK